MHPLTIRRAGARLRSGRSAPVAGRWPLAALRARLDAGSVRAAWAMNPDGVLGRALVMHAGATYTVPLALSHPVSLTGEAMLLPHDWRDGRDAVRATVAVTGPHGRRRELWSGTLWAADRGRPRGRPVECRLPAWSTALELSIRVAGTLRPRSVARAIWLEPALTAPEGAAHHRAPAAPPVPAAPDPSDGPLISVLIPVHDPPEHMLEEAIASVHAQTFPDWELCLVDDGSTSPEVLAALQHHAASDPRIHLQRRDHAGGISAATNTALGLATGRYIALLDHDDTLAPDALAHVADTIATQPDLDMLYTDEDVIGERGLIERHPKPGWSPEHMAALMYTCHLGVYRRQLAIELGGFHPRFDGCQDYDFVLRLMERTDRIAHIPRILYHWRAHATSTAGGDAKPYAYLAQPGAISAHLRRSGVDAEIHFGQFPGLHRIVHRVDPATSVALVLAVDDPHGLERAAASWIAQSHPAWSVVIVAPTHARTAVGAALRRAGIEEERTTIVEATPDHPPTAALATAARAATRAGRAEHLLLMQTPAAGLTHDWLTRLIGYSHQDGIAAAGPVVLSADGRIQQGGIAIPDGIPLHMHHSSPATAAPPVVYNVTAVSGVLATRRDTYDALGGLDPQYGELALIDYCLRATTTDRRIVIVPDSRLQATGPDHTTNDLPNLQRLRDSWAHTHARDPYYNPGYRTDRGDFILASTA